jgi:uncharacterized protein GlcG (DUF336 family)
MLTLRQARQIVDACVEHATKLGVQQSIVIVDPAGNPITMDTMDGTRLLRSQFAQGKAFAAVFYRRATAESAKMIESNPGLYHGALGMFPGKMFLVQGGFPIIVNGELVGGIGVSGATGEQDEEVAQAGLRTLAG